MAHYAKVEDGIVTQVIVANTKQWCEENLGGTWIQTSYNTHGGQHNGGQYPLRKNYAGIGYSYDAERDAFIPPKPFNSWTLNNETCLWESPVPYPADGKMYYWNEDDQSWSEINN